MLSSKRFDKRRVVAVSISCLALAGATLGSALAARSQLTSSPGSSSGWAGLARHSMLMAETRGADADELNTINGWIDDDDQGEVDHTESPDPAESEAPDASEAPDESEAPDPSEAPEKTKAPDPGEHESTAVDENDQGDNNDDQGENEQDKADSGQKDDAGSGQHDSGDAGEHDDGGDSGGD